MKSNSVRNIAALAGGVGGARLADGLARACAGWEEPGNLSVIVNVGDDFEHLGLRISPDLDTVCYTLAGIANQETGWGLAGESFNVLEQVLALNGEGWFRLGDKDIATHLVRTSRLKAGQPLSKITADLCASLGVKAVVLPVSDDVIPTIVYTPEGRLAFQEYFVHQHCEPVVEGFRFAGAGQAWPAPGVLEAIETADALVICPSNPWVSVDPILAVPGVRETILKRKSAGMPVVAVSPIIGGQTVKGPAAKMYRELGIEPSALAVAKHYAGLLSGFVLDIVDRDLADSIQSDSRDELAMPTGLPVLVVDTLMKTVEVRQRLAEDILDFAAALKTRPQEQI